MNNLSPKYLCKPLSPRKCSHLLRNDFLQLLELHKTRLTNYGDTSLAYGTVSGWNMLPLHITHSPSVEIFKTNLQTYLFLQNPKHYNWKLALSNLCFYLLLSFFLTYQNFLHQVIGTYWWKVNNYVCLFSHSYWFFFLWTVMCVIIDLICTSITWNVTYCFTSSVYMSFSMIPVDYCIFV